MPENRFKHFRNIVTRPVLLRLRTLLRSLKEGLAPVCLDRWALGEVPAEIDSFLLPRVHSGRDLVGHEFTDNMCMIAWHSYGHPPCSASHFWQNFSWNVMKCLHIKRWGTGMKRFASVLHLYPMSYWSVGWAWASKVTWNRLRLRVGMPEGWGVYMVLSLWQGYAKRCGVPGGSWWCLVAFQETKVAMEKSSSLGARGVSHILDTSSFSDAQRVAQTAFHFKLTALHHPGHWSCQFPQLQLHRAYWWMIYIMNV